MDIKEFKNLFGEIAKKSDLKKAFGGWYKESSECLVILELQKSNFGNYYQLLLKTFIQGAFDKKYTPNKEVIKSSMGHITSNVPLEYIEIFDFDKPKEDREESLKELFENYIIPYVNKMLSKTGIKELAQEEDIFLLPAVREELSRL